MYCLMLAKAAGAGRLIAIDISSHVLNLARQLGATHTIDPAQCDAKEAVYDILQPGRTW
jgi:Zn-dependent alcohol dehydrogenase